MSSDGALLELVRRGKKDAFFLTDASSSSSTPYFNHVSVDNRSPTVREMRIQQPIGAVQFGSWVDVELPRTGDILTSVDIRIRLPTWLPTDVAVLNRAGGHVIEIVGSSGTRARYGWTNRIANVIVERWALFADEVILVDGFGFVNGLVDDSETTHHHAPLLHATTGSHDGTAQSIQAAATPLSELAFHIPLPGCQEICGVAGVGLPICALKRQRLYVRMWLRPLSELVESSVVTDVSNSSRGVANGPVYDTCPSPWNGRAIFIDGSGSSYVTLSEFAMAPIQLYGRFGILHCEDELRESLIAKAHSIPFRQQQRGDLTLESAISGTRIRHRLEIQGYLQYLLVAIQSQARRLQNKFTDFTPPGSGNEWIETISLDINSTPRIYPWSPRLIRDLSQKIMLNRDINTSLMYLIFGAVEGSHTTGGDSDREIAGACNITRTCKTDLLIQLGANILADPALPNSRTAFVTMIAMSWNVLEVRDGVCKRMFV